MDTSECFYESVYQQKTEQIRITYTKEVGCSDMG